MAEFFEGFLQGLQLLWSILSAEPLLVIIFLVFMVGSLAVGLAVSVIREKKLRKSGMLDVDVMSGRMFEEYL